MPIFYEQLRRPLKADDTDEENSNARKGKGWWRASEPPVESFSDVDEGQEWRYQIIGEEVDGFGKIWCISSTSLVFLNLLIAKYLGTRYEGLGLFLFPLTDVYKVRWDDWSRADKTKTTWDDGSTISALSWNSAQRHLRRDEAAMSLEIEVLHTTDIHNTLTHLRSQGGDEKAKRLKTEAQPNFLEEMHRNLARHQVDVSNLPAFCDSRSQRQSARRKTEISVASSSSSTLFGIRSRSSIGSSPEQPPLTSASSFYSNRFSPSIKNKPVPSGSSASLDSGDFPPIRLPMKRKKRIDSPDSSAAFGPFSRPSHPSPSASQSELVEMPAIR